MPPEVADEVSDFEFAKALHCTLNADLLNCPNTSSSNSSSPSNIATSSSALNITENSLAAQAHRFRHEVESDQQTDTADEVFTESSDEEAEQQRSSVTHIAEIHSEDNSGIDQMQLIQSVRCTSPLSVDFLDQLSVLYDENIEEYHRVTSQLHSFDGYGRPVPDAHTLITEEPDASEMSMIDNMSAIYIDSTRDKRALSDCNVMAEVKKRRSGESSGSPSDTSAIRTLLQLPPMDSPTPREFHSEGSVPVSKVNIIPLLCAMPKDKPKSDGDGDVFKKPIPTSDWLKHYRSNSKEEKG